MASWRSDRRQMGACVKQSVLLPNARSGIDHVSAGLNVKVSLSVSSSTEWMLDGVHTYNNAPSVVDTWRDSRDSP
jgi:hypothetical protein